MATSSQVLDQAIRRLNELSTTAPVRWTRSELLVYLNDALRELNLIAGDYQNTQDLTVDNTDPVWDVPTATIGVLSVRSSDGYLLRETVEDLDKAVDWEDTTKTRLRIKSFAPLGLNKIVIYPLPNEPVTLKLEVLSEYDEVLDDGSDLVDWLRVEYHTALEDFIVARAMFKEGGAEFAQAVSMYNRFIDTVQQLSHRNIVRRYPAWEVQPEAKPSQVTLREGL